MVSSNLGVRLEIWPANFLSKIPQHPNSDLSSFSSETPLAVRASRPTKTHGLGLGEDLFTLGESVSFGSSGAQRRDGLVHGGNGRKGGGAAADGEEEGGGDGELHGADNVAKIMLGIFD